MSVVAFDLVGCINEQLVVYSMDEKGLDNAHHLYEIVFCRVGPTILGSTILKFQKGPLEDGKPNGLTNEILLAVILDRLNDFQRGPFACPENTEAINHLLEALSTLQRRTKARIAQGIEGTLQP